MANPLLQQARQRKMYYWGAIAVLFTVSLIHRYWVINEQAKALQLRETVRGEVELTSSAVRLMLTGSRGIAVTMLWYNAMDKQKRGEWHELELLVKSITKLQPYFITPWLYQSWNISFNVAVECDKPRDKYYYISRGLELLAEGERRNRGTGEEGAAADPNRIVYPGHPELRHYMGFTYQLKIGTSDERLTMRTLLELSCIDPVERNPDRFESRDELNQAIIRVDEFVKFCQKYPRPIRRLNEQLGRDPEGIVKFLREHLTIPGRFKPAKLGEATQSELKDPLDQFPILPPPDRDAPNPGQRDLTSESVDVFLVCRTWYDFAQKPLPPPDPKPKIAVQEYDKLKYRMPKQMMSQLFRQYPARAEVYIAETLESEGFFDSEGWDLVSAFFPKLPIRPDETSIVGKEEKYHSRRAWEVSFEMYKDYGLRNGLYFGPREAKELEKEAELFRINALEGRVLKPEENAPLPAKASEAMSKSYDAHMRLYTAHYYRKVSNFDSFFDQAEGERDPVTAVARKLIFRAERKRKGVRTSTMLDEYEKAWPMYVYAALKHPKFAQVSSMQEDLAEIYQRYLGETQEVHQEDFRKAALAAGRVCLPTIPDWPSMIAQQNVATRKLYGYDEKSKTELQQFLLKVTQIKARTGTLDRIQFVNGEGATEAREELFLFTQGALVAMNPSLAATVSYPGTAFLYLTRLAPDAEAEAPRGWAPLLTKQARDIARNRLKLDR